MLSYDFLFNDFTKKARYLTGLIKRRMIHLNLQILYSCNFKCEICDFWQEPYTKMRRLSVADVQAINEKLKPLNPLLISLGGGEPFMHKELADIVKILSKDNFLAMISNGWYVTPKKAKAILQNEGMYEVSISIDYATPEKHDKQRGKEGAFEHAVNALKFLNENRSYPHQRIHMISVVMDDNLDEIESLIQLAKKIGVTYFVTLYSEGRGEKASRLSRQEVSNELLRLKRKYPTDFVSLPGYLKRFSEITTEEQGITPCYAGKNLFNIDCQGNVTLCIDRLQDPVGNILTDDLSKLQERLLVQYQQNNCGGCWTSCRGNIEPLLYGKNRLRNFLDSYQMTKSIPLINR
jgi:MoaA/NifB/PqqE/SkfB family radical SAM enzyme